MNCHTRRAAFSLIELCIGIGIAALVAALLIPAMRTAKEKGEASACLGNLRNWAAAINAYAGEHSGKLPQNEYPRDALHPNTGNHLFIYALAPYAGYRYPVTDPALFRKTILACPAEKEFTTPPFYHYALTVDLNYRINGSTPERDPTAVRLQSLENAASYVLLSDSYDSCVLYNYTRTRMETFTNATRRHGGAPNFLYADGHVAPFREKLVGYGDPGGMEPIWRNRWFANGIPPNRR